MYYAIRHVTRFHYAAPVSESVMEVRMQPREEARQRCLRFTLQTQPFARSYSYNDSLNNTVHYFDVPKRHSKLEIIAESLVEVLPPLTLPDPETVPTWEDIDALRQEHSLWDWLCPSHFARPTALLQKLIDELSVKRDSDPLTTLRQLNATLFQTFTYAPSSTRADSPIDEALANHKGVCQDFAHIMIAIVRELGIPCRYVSGYLFHGRENHDRSEEDATHAWVEAYIPNLGWLGLDPTNNLIASERHIRAAIGRDYADVPPTHGIFKGNASSELFVAVRVTPSEAPILVPAIADDDLPPWDVDELERPGEQQ